MKLKTRKLVMSTLVGSIAVAIAGLAVADVTIRLRPNQDFVVKDKGGANNFRVKVDGAGVEVPHGPLDIKNKTSGGEIKFYEGSGGGSNSVTVKSPDALAADVVYTLPAADGTATQVLQTDGKGVLGWIDKVQVVSTGSGCDSIEEVVDYKDNIVPGGRTWMDRNLGASQKAKSSKDAASYGALFQWGRGRDGHECSWRTKYPGTVASSAVGAGNLWDGKFITGKSINGTNWLSPQDNALWGDGTPSGGTTKGRNDPCPTGYQVPNKNELAKLGIKNPSDAFNALKLPAGGLRDAFGNSHYIGQSGYYWASTAVLTSPHGVSLDITISSASLQTSPREFGISVRCIKSL